MDDSRPLSIEPTKALPESLTRHQPRSTDEAAMFPSLGVLPSGIEIAGRYQVEGELTVSGGEADVFFCRDKEADRKVAVKVYRAEIRPKEELLEKLKGFDHENLIRLLNFDTWNKRFFEAMEFAAGGALAAGMPYAEEFTKKVIIPQVLAGMNYLHENNIIHRDIKPTNLFFRDIEKSKVIIADYGISSLLQEWEGSLHQSTSLKGTIDFAAPETFSGIFGKEVDYYSLGLTLLILMTGETPFAGMSEQQKMYYHLTERIQPPGECSDRFVDLIAGLLCKERGERWGYDEMQAWLRGEQVLVPEFRPARTNFVYTLAKGRANSIEGLGELMLENPLEAKKHIRKRLIYDEIKKIDQSLASAIDDIQSEAANMDECLIEIIYTFNPKLPYRLLEGAEARTPKELSRLIDQNQETWAAGKEQLFNGMIPAWLRATDYGELVGEWKKVAGKFSPK